jgi:SAM-dependent methyltransferase
MLAALERLAASPDVRDRAFAAGVLSLRRDVEDREEVAALYERVRETALAQHAAVRERIRGGTLAGRALLDHLQAVPPELRDHFVEEILDVAYPPMQEAALPRDAIPYCPSGLAEILFAIDHGGLDPGKTFVDLGSGLGKVTLLVALLTGARTCGVEIDPGLVGRARTAARSLGIEHAEFLEGDIRDAPLPSADVYYLYIPVAQSDAVVARLAECAAARRIRVFSPALDLKGLPWLKRRDVASYWLAMYEGEVSDRRPQPDAKPASAEARAHALADCERRINLARASVFAANDGVVTAVMTDLEREWRALHAADVAERGG